MIKAIELTWMLYYRLTVYILLCIFFFYIFIYVFSKMLNYRISSNKRLWRLLTFETVRCGVY